MAWRLILGWAFFGLTLGNAGAQGLDFEGPEVDLALRAIRAPALRAHVRFLAGDSLEGRGTGTRGHRIAAEYVVAQLEALALEPAGSAGTFLQSVPLRSARVVESQSALQLSGQSPLCPGRDYVLSPSFVEEDARLRAPLAFVGFGVSATGLGHDDYAHVDVRGRIVVLFSGVPAGFPHDQRAHYGSSRTKQSNAAAHGAVGIVSLRPPSRERRTPWSRVLQMRRTPSMCWLDGRGRPSDSPERIRLRAALSARGARSLLGGDEDAVARALKAARAGRPQDVQLRGIVEARTLSEWESLASPNVVARLEGSDPDLADESVVFSAHLDHLGIGQEVNGDAIYNGAYDNASGTAGLLEVARAFAQLSSRPRRSIVFVAVTAEEKGLLGSDYFAHHPPVDRQGIVANVNLDGLLMLYEPRDVVAYGAEHSSLQEVAERAARRVGLELSPDPWPEQSLFVRSDHYSFVRQGIPAVFLMPGFESGSDEDGARLLRDWLASRYHSPKDDLDQPMDFDAGVRLARAAFLIGWSVASQIERPRWNEGDFFGEEYGATIDVP